MVIIMTMIVANIHQIKAKLSEYLDLAARGERVLICKRNQPIAELVPVDAPRTTPRPVGLARGQVQVPDSFFAPLPADLEDAFAGLNRQTRAIPRVADAAGHPYGSPDQTPAPRRAVKRDRARKR